MYNHSKYPMGILAAASTIFGLNTYRITEQRFWLYGTAAIFAVIPFTFAAIMGINHKLEEDKGRAGSAVPRENVVSRLAGWLLRHRVRVLLAFVAAGLFYAAEEKSTTVFFNQPGQPKI